MSKLYRFKELSEMQKLNAILDFRIKCKDKIKRILQKDYAFDKYGNIKMGFQDKVVIK